MHRWRAVYKDENWLCSGFYPRTEFGMQLDALAKSGCEKIFEEKVSGTKADRPELASMRTTLRKGDVVYIYKLDRLGRSLKHLLELASDFEKDGVGLVSLNDQKKLLT